MASSFYATGLNAFLLGDIDWVADDIRVILVDANDYTVNLTTHDFLNDIPSGARIATVALTGKTASGGVADANDVTFPLATGDQSEALVIYKHTGTESTSQLICYIDSATGLPVSPNGNDIVLTWDGGTNKIFKL